VYGNVTTVGSFESRAGGEILCFRALVNRVLVESLGYERIANRNTYTVVLRDRRLGLVKEFVVWVRIFRPELRTSARRVIPAVPSPSMP